MAKAGNQLSNNRITELEIQNISNFIVKESIDIVQEEVEYFFQTREGIVSTLFDASDLNLLGAKKIRDSLNKSVYSRADITRLVKKIEKHISRLMQRSVLPEWENNFRFDLAEVSWVEPGIVISILEGEFKTLSYSTNMAKLIDTAFGKLNKGYIPAGFNKLSSKMKIGDNVLAVVEADSSKIAEDLRKKIIKLSNGSIKQYQHKLIKDLTAQVLKYEIPQSFKPVQIKAIQTA